MKIIPEDDFKCYLEWTTEIEPEIFADIMQQVMLGSVEGIKKVL